MVLKQVQQRLDYFIKFESDVTSDGTQTFGHAFCYLPQFESDVTSDGTQT